ncbi:MAG TPA: hypothetical protein VFY56_15900 [Propionibacteriaceae bacterium]|nr:hypothetical protein [Propionibacteriaceae bacterium]
MTTGLQEAFNAGDLGRMRSLLAPDLVAWVTNANFAAHLLLVEKDRVTEWRMADAKPAESDQFWS